VETEALARGQGGLKAMRELTGMSRPTIVRDMRELRENWKLAEAGRIRKPGGGRERLEYADSELTSRIEKITDENTAGDPMSLLR
jgi:hypothetical protein